jgi:protein-disulfide isomerase
MVALALACVAAGCGKKSSANPDEFKDVDQTFDDSEPPPEQREPVNGANLDGLGSAEKARFDQLADKLPSPCGKAHSLRTSRNKDPECKSAPFAVAYLVEMLKDGLTNDEVREVYDLRYKPKDKDTRKGFKTDGAPSVGPNDGRIVLVEFFDYGCPACSRFKAPLEEAIAGFPADVVLYYKMFPLDAHPDSPGAAQAALAAAKQGKFKEMHDVLFANQFKHKKADLWAHAKAIGLDMAKFETDFAAAEPMVRADKAEGEAAGVESTPTLYINGKRYDGLEHSKYLKMWIEEELAK